MQGPDMCPGLNPVGDKLATPQHDDLLPDQTSAIRVAGRLLVLRSLTTQSHQHSTFLLAYSSTVTLCFSTDRYKSEIPSGLREERVLTEHVERVCSRRCDCRLSRSCNVRRRVSIQAQESPQPESCPQAFQLKVRLLLSPNPDQTPARLASLHIFKFREVKPYICPAVQEPALGPYAVVCNFTGALVRLM